MVINNKIFVCGTINKFITHDGFHKLSNMIEKILSNFTSQSSGLGLFKKKF
jgi:hypothetical protein